MKNLIKFLVSILCMISTSGNLFCQEPVDSLKIGEEYREYRYLYADNPDRAIALYDSTKEIIDTFITLKIDSIKRLYKVLNIDSFVNFNDKKYNLIAITDHLDNWDWTIISEYATDSCDDKLEINKSYYMTIYYFENEDFAIRIPWNSLVEIFFDGDSVFIDKKHVWCIHQTSKEVVLFQLIKTKTHCISNNATPSGLSRRRKVEGGRRNE